MLKEVKKEQTNVVDYKTRQQQFLEWLKEVIEVNFKQNEQIEDAILIWNKKNEKGETKTVHARFNITNISDVEYYRDCLNDYILYRKFDDFMREHISDYLEYVE